MQLSVTLFYFFFVIIKTQPHILVNSTFYVLRILSELFRCYFKCLGDRVFHGKSKGFEGDRY